MYKTVNTPSRVSSQNYTQWTDEELLAKYRLSQHRPAFEELVHRYERELFSYLRYYLGSAESAEDAFQTTFLQVHLKCESFEEGRKFRPWLYRIATNQAIDLRRRASRHQAVSIDEHCAKDIDSASFADMLPGSDIDPAVDAMDNEQASQVRKAMEQLPELLRQVLFLVFFQSMTYRDAAASLGIPFGSIGTRVHLAVKKMNLLLADKV